MNKKLLASLTLILLACVALYVKNVYAAMPDGDPVLVPEPISTSLFILGGGALSLKAYLTKKKK